MAASDRADWTGRLGGLSAVPAWLRSTPMIVTLSVAAGLLLVISRQPHMLINPQLYAEDGKVWFHDAYRMAR
jgi:hypothetical protein